VEPYEADAHWYARTDTQYAEMVRSAQSAATSRGQVNAVHHHPPGSLRCVEDCVLIGLDADYMDDGDTYGAANEPDG
jgi:hypothetical protein